ncbi:hypothetical protein B8W95_13700, partial [Staphylococcus pasteuri]
AAGAVAPLTVAPLSLLGAVPLPRVRRIVLVFAKLTEDVLPRVVVRFALAFDPELFAVTLGAGFAPTDVVGRLDFLL